MKPPKTYISAAPHIHVKETVNDIMLDVVIALLPAAVMGVYFFGFRAALIIIVSVVSAVVCEFLFCVLTKRPQTAWDLSAVISGLLLAFSLSASVPLWLPALGSGFAIIFIKKILGGLMRNLLNPALSAKVLLLIAFPLIMTRETYIAMNLGSLFMGNILGSIGETSSWALLLGAGYLLIRRVISWRIPVAFLAAFTLLVFIFGTGDGLFTGNPLYELLLGSILLGAFFMATDYSTSPMTPPGQIIFGLGCGIVSAVLRFYGGLPQGSTYAILFMNLWVPLIDKFIKPKVYGTQNRSPGKSLGKGMNIRRRK